MKPFKSRIESDELKFLRSLFLRYKLTGDELAVYYSREKGYAGELAFDKWIENLPGKWLSLNDLTLKFDNNIFQIDNLFVFQGKIHNINVKNFENDYYIEDGRWYAEPRTEIKNPMAQLERSEGLLRRLLKSYGFDYPIESYLVFINPNFHLYNAPRDLPAVFPTQLNKYKDRLLSIPANITKRDIMVAEKLVSLHIEKPSYTIKPKYSYAEVKNGLICSNCHSFFTGFNKHFLECDNCKHIESVESGVLRAVEEYLLLFPDRKITVKAIYEWCKIIPIKTIRRILLKYLDLVGNGWSAHYVKREDH